MSKLTALQIAMRITQRYANSLFDEHTARGRQFMQEMSECLEQEREQIIEAHKQGQEFALLMNMPDSKEYYNETYKGGSNE